ncbi:hypothetical protein QZM22_10755 [Burkholderia oklahomensis]|uniref:hypothetical protein n=1 Tax=Burkholderia oklahomensis TaxID=342113 RepID=UPI00264F2F43|nr:hypothetical protein [Burkholderia oklahomensis]MDN7672992.1 hypothetical protein [Burkholderia oklahomensis]
MVRAWPCSTRLSVGRHRRRIDLQPATEARSPCADFAGGIERPRIAARCDCSANAGGMRAASGSVGIDAGAATYADFDSDFAIVTRLFRIAENDRHEFGKRAAAQARLCARCCGRAHPATADRNC